jgi:non-specific serine/threonine protein kinase
MAGADGGTAHRVGRLSPEYTSFVGRQQEVREVGQLVMASRLVTLTGTGGIGKTRLAMRATSQLRRAFADGVWQIELAGLRDSALLEHALVEAWGIGGAGDVPTARLLADYVADRELLLVLDNCDYLLDACATLAGALLRAGPRLRVLCTSRQSLCVVGETVWEVPPLPVPRPDTPPNNGDDAALRLFLERAAAATPGFTLTSDNQRAVVEICDRLDGLPLAIELAAAQLRTLSVEQLADGLVDRFRLLSARHAVPAHHRTLRDTFDWSYALCSPDEQALWTRLAVFNGGFDLDAAIAVCAGDDLPAGSVLDLLAGLIDKSIVRRDNSGEPVGYRLLDSVREYALDRQRADGTLRGTLCRRHAEFFLRRAERFDAAWFGPDQPRLCAALRVDLDNLRAALSACVTAPGLAEACLRLAAALRYYWTACGGLAEGRYWLARALAADAAPTMARAAALSAYTRVLITQADRANAAASAADCFDLAHRLGDPPMIARATQDLGTYLFLFGDDLPRARHLLEEALDRHARIEPVDDADVAMAQVSLATTVLYQGDMDRAERLCGESEARCRSYGDQWWRCNALVGRALVALARREPAEATRHLRETLPPRSALGDTFGLAQAVDLLSRAAAAAGDHERAARLTGVAHRIWHEIGRSGFGSRHYQARMAEAREQARGELGDRAYRAAYRLGWELPLDDAVAYARGAEPTPDAPPAAGSPAVPAGSPLTPRERQVAELIAEGLSNKQIAARLFIAQRTAESHAGNILRKLGFTSRSQVASWIAHHGT